MSGRMVSTGISDVVVASLYSEKTRLKKCLIMINMIISVGYRTHLSTFRE